MKNIIEEMYNSDLFLIDRLNHTDTAYQSKQQAGVCKRIQSGSADGIRNDKTYQVKWQLWTYTIADRFRSLKLLF